MRNELYHYGILGMKWGIRRYQPYSVKPRGSGKGGKEIGEAKQITDYRKKARHTDPRKLTTEELNRDISRINLERQYRTTSYSKGEKFVREAGRQIVMAVVTGTGISLGKKFLQKLIDDAEENFNSIPGAVIGHVTK